MRYQKLSPRQNLAMTWWNRPGFEGYDGIICDGSIRSGKTVAMTVGFVMWAMSRFQGQNFALCGKTIESLRRNVTSNLPNWLAGVFSFREYRTENKIVVTAAGRSNNFYLFGGRDESSASLIQGITLAGVLLDEVALMPRSFVEQACARCSVDGSKLWFNCNPEGPSHWFYLTWVLEAAKRNMLHLHFTMDDNLSLSASVKARYESLYSSIISTLSGPVAAWLTAVYTVAKEKKLTVGGTVKLVIMASDYKAPTPTLLEEIQTAIDPEQNAGEGLGLAPIGHVVHVTGVTAEKVDIELHLTYASDWSWEAVKSYVEAVIDAYFVELSQDWASSDFLTVRISQIESRILAECSSMITDIGGTKINGQESNLALGPDSIPSRGEVTDG